jgi:acyl-homoserine lactone acylase PvdQ
MPAHRAPVSAIAALLLCLTPATTLTAPVPSRGPSPVEAARWIQQTNRVTITRDDWGIAHVTGHTDADAVFGMIYAQAEDDFPRIETNYLNALGRLAEAEGESALYQDLRMKIFIDPADLQRRYAASPDWLQALMTAFADGLNFYLATHPQEKPRVLTHFEPWMALSFTEGSIGGDIERINLAKLQSFYTQAPVKAQASRPSIFPEDGEFAEPTGSNGMAIAPSNTLNHHALLLINPHTPFFFRSELQMSSDEGLHAYGAVTWGQIFLYQGFNDRVGWMHTSSSVDAVDEYLETIVKKDGRLFTQYGDTLKPLQPTEITVPYKTAIGISEKRFTVYRSVHGPIIRTEGSHWVAVRLMQRPVEALEQSFLRTKAHDYASFRKTLELDADSSNNTVFASADGDIAYVHGNYIPRRDTRFNWTKPVDGSDPATEYQGLLSVAELPQLLNPASGWLYNSNNWPWSGAGASSLHQKDFPAYVDSGHETARGLHAIRVLSSQKNFTIDTLRDAAYDSYLPWFEKTIPALLKAFDALPEADPNRTSLAPNIALLRPWNLRWSADSSATSLAVFWAEELRRQLTDTATAAHLTLEDFVATQATSEALITALTTASTRLSTDFNKPAVPWGEINRFQRLTSDLVQPFSDTAPSIPVAFTSGVWGSLASFGAHAYPGTRKWYGNTGNSFVAIVEFGDKVHARAVTAGGESGHPGSPHFNDQAQRYADGNLREVYFYPAQLTGHTERVYHPGS